MSIVITLKSIRASEFIKIAQELEPERLDGMRFVGLDEGSTSTLSARFSDSTGQTNWHLHTLDLQRAVAAMLATLPEDLFSLNQNICALNALRAENACRYSGRDDDNVVYQTNEKFTVPLENDQHMIFFMRQYIRDGARLEMTIPR